LILTKKKKPVNLGVRITKIQDAFYAMIRFGCLKPVRSSVGSNEVKYFSNINKKTVEMFRLFGI